MSYNPLLVAFVIFNATFLSLRTTVLSYSYLVASSLLLFATYGSPNFANPGLGNLLVLKGGVGLLFFS